jgi:hypothetical protein
MYLYVVCKCSVVSKAKNEICTFWQEVEALNRIRVECPVIGSGRYIVFPVSNKLVQQERYPIMLQYTFSMASTNTSTVYRYSIESLQFTLSSVSVNRRRRLLIFGCLGARFSPPDSHFLQMICGMFILHLSGKRQIKLRLTTGTR